MISYTGTSIEDKPAWMKRGKNFMLIYIKFFLNYKREIKNENICKFSRRIETRSMFYSLNLDGFILNKTQYNVFKFQCLFYNCS